MNNSKERNISHHMYTEFINEIEFDHIKLKFKQPFCFSYYIDNGYYCYEYQKFHYFGRAITKEEMIEELKEDIFADWMVYVENKDAILSNKAKILKTQLMMLLERIPS